MTLEESQEIGLFLDLFLCHFESVRTRSVYTDRDNEIWGVLVYIQLLGFELEDSKIVINKKRENSVKYGFVNG